MSRGDTIAVLVNQTAGKGRLARVMPEVLRRLGYQHQVLLLEAGSGAEAEAACRVAVEESVAALVAVGGDGTVHRALQAVAGTTIPFGVVPAGTGNDFATALGLGPDPVEAADKVAAAIVSGSTRHLDLGRVTTPGGQARWFGVVLGAGFDAVVNERANRLRFPRGPRRYDVATLMELARLRPRRYHLRLDGVAHDVEAVVVAVGNTDSYGGGFRICPGADPTDGQLDIVVGAAMDRATLMRLKPRVREGTHVDHPLVATHRASVIEIAADGITAYADGERTYPLPITITCVSGALNVLS